MRSRRLRSIGRSRAGRVTATGVALATLLAAAPSGVAASVLAPGGLPGGAPGASGDLLANYHAVYHPSDENYLAIAGGDTYARGAIYWPDIKDPHRNLGDELQARSMSWMAYEQGMGYRCNDRASTEFRYDKYYYPDDAPFINYTDVSASRARCKAHLVSTRLLRPALLNASTTPVFSWIAADDYYDGESAGNGDRHSREVQDGWLQRTIGPILASPPGAPRSRC